MKVFIKTFGCRVNQVESQAIREQFTRGGADFVANFEEADLCLLNTCTVTAKADSDVEKLTRQISSRNPAARLILTGCYAAAHEGKIKTAFPNAEIINKYDIGKEVFHTEDVCWTVSGAEGRSRAFVKIQDGCDCFCSYCIVPFARNRKVSKPMLDTLFEIEKLVAAGFKEIVLTGINIGNYKCPVTGVDLAVLAGEIFKLEGKFRIRFSSIELNTVTDALLKAAKEGGDKFCNYFHIPLQSGSTKILKDMNRHYSTEQYAARIAQIRAMFPGIGIYADIIAGYPTETEEDFTAAYKFVEELELSGLHVFSYSSRPGTAAAQLPQHSAEVIKQRADKLRELDASLRANFAKAQIGNSVQVLIERTKNSVTTGVAGNFVRINFNTPARQGDLVNAKVISSNDAECTAEYEK
ncbi:threonylcarbamoyladenosine tRNA methylthiotransferase MtaB [Elusimicrobium simillimum]|uniref:tRNA (N(6)-L-threonylcarbamoyladenosine(37)-C(2))- methylthiotransferase MtaB n=1 Tax=Elusimicrobium simillimum TaxID=3143438 RepID=UPI003C6F6252